MTGDRTWEELVGAEAEQATSGFADTDSGMLSLKFES